MKGKKILVACNRLDDVLIEKILSGTFCLDYARDAQDILQKDQADHYDLFLLDIKYLQEDPDLWLHLKKGRNIPIVALSSEPGDARGQQFRQAGCDACYIKPFHKQTFTLFIDYWIMAGEQ